MGDRYRVDYRGDRRRDDRRYGGGGGDSRAYQRGGYDGRQEYGGRSSQGDHHRRPVPSKYQSSYVGQKRQREEEEPVDYKKAMIKKLLKLGEPGGPGQLQPVSAAGMCAAPSPSVSASRVEHKSLH